MELGAADLFLGPDPDQPGAIFLRLKLALDPLDKKKIAKRARARGAGQLSDHSHISRPAGWSRPPVARLKFSSMRDGQDFSHLRGRLGNQNEPPAIVPDGRLTDTPV